MAGKSDLSQQIEELQQLLHDKFGLRKRALDRMLARTGRRMPRRMHARARALIEAQKLAANPKLARQLDTTALDKGFAEVKAHLEKIDPVARRKAAALRLAGVVAFNFLAVTGAFVFWLWWAGYV